MSTYHAVAHVLNAVKYLLDQVAPPDISGYDVDIGAPSEPSGVANPTVRLCVYHLAPSPALRNSDLPTRGAGTRVLQRPVAALDIQFLMSFYGDRATLVPERLAGWAISVLHAYPVLSSNVLSGGSISGSNLDDQVDRVVLSPLALSLEDINRLWGTLTQTPYVLSVAWQASAVLLERPMTRHVALPVASPSITIQTMGGPLLDSVESEDETRPITWDSVVLLKGRGLRNETTRLQIGSTTFSVSATSDTVRSTSIRLDLSAHKASAGATYSAGLTPGIHALRVVHPVFRSNALPLMVSPDVTVNSWSSPTLTVTVKPALGADQIARAHLSRLTTGDSPTQLLYAFDEASRSPVTEGISPPFTIGTSLTFTISSDVYTGGHTWVIRVEVDGLFSVPELNPTSGRYDTPSVVLS